MGEIKLLDPFVIQHIAAGEVIDRPASILKELLENALDARSSTIMVEINGGGIESISISDNGCGMDEADAALCLERHATSKISMLDDLERISTFGFRGEALASIAAVARFDLSTRQKGTMHGTKVQAEGGAIRHIGACGTPEGTHILVRDLFFNVPARKKFLKSTQTEESACLDMIGKVALSRCDVLFQVKKNGKILYSLPKGEELKDRYLKLFPQTEESQLFSIEASRDSMNIKGLIAGPLFCKTSRNSIFMYVNSRFVRPGILSQAVVDGYSGYLQAGKFPVALLFLEINGKWVDVNVHPTKAEVRFSHPKEVYGFLEKNVAMRLSQVQENVRRHVIPFFVPEENLTRHGGNGYSVPMPNARYEDLTLFERLAPYTPQEDIPKILGSVAKTYGIFQENETLFLVDLHNAHERINFDMLESRFQEKTGPAQELLAPLMIELSGYQQMLVGKYGVFFREIGLELEDFGGGKVLIRSVPLGFEQLGQKRFLLSMLERLEKVDEIKDPSALQKKILITMACRSSVQAGDDLSLEEMQSLFEKLLRSSNPYFCPHGRPIIIKLTLDEVHRLFRRK